MLEKGSYPYHLKKRIRSDEGHLSNVQALELFQHYRSPFLQLLILSHLSKNNNKPDVVKKLFAPHSGNVKVLIASRHEASKVFEISGKGVVSRKGAKGSQRRKGTKEGQLSLF
jgi:hypothetical protein